MTIAFAATWFVLGMVAGASVTVAIGSLLISQAQRENETQQVATVTPLTTPDPIESVAQFTSLDATDPLPPLRVFKVHRRYPPVPRQVS